MNFFRKLIFTAVCVLAISTIGGLAYIFSGTENQEDIILEIPEGASFGFVVKTLKEKNILKDTQAFKIYAALRGDLRKIKPGEYKITKNSTKKSILDAITHGDVLLYKITIPEGYNIYQIADILEGQLKISKKDFLDKAKSRELLNKWGINGESMEGYLYPETYNFPKSITTTQAIDKMAQTFQDKYSESITEEGKKLGLDKKEIVILASMIEKETGLGSERELISAVFHNRMKRGMRMQSDPTTIYGIFERYRGNLTKKDLLEETPYNTYRIKGLPAGPIANPGMESIRAAVSPSANQYLYFVSKNDKSHVFANNLKEHNANVNKYQLNK